MQADPFSPPKSDVDAGAPAEVTAPAQAMPGTAIAATILVGVMALFNVVTVLTRPTPLNGATIAVSTLIIFGLVRGHALAWQWGIVIPTLMVLGSLVVLAPALANFSENPIMAISAVVAFAIYAAIPVLLSTQSSRIFYGLRCPKCGQVKGRAASFLFAKRKCAACKFVWTQVRS